jgi:hypothetical protein
VAEARGSAGREADRVKVSFFGGLTFGRVAQPRKALDGVLSVAMTKRSALCRKMLKNGC